MGKFADQCNFTAKCQGKSILLTDRQRRDGQKIKTRTVPTVYREGKQETEVKTMGPVIYKCTILCPLHKRCFILKTVEEIKQPVEVLVKCTAQKGKDVKVTIGGDERPP